VARSASSQRDPGQRCEASGRPLDLEPLLDQPQEILAARELLALEELREGQRQARIAGVEPTRDEPPREPFVLAREPRQLLGEDLGDLAGLRLVIVPRDRPFEEPARSW